MSANTQVSPHFMKEEFACKCGCGTVIICGKLVELLEDVRAHFGKPVIIISGTRCEKHNREEGGKPKSYHLTGAAADIQVGETTAQEAFRYLDQSRGDVIGLAQINKNNIHVDVRGYRARWTYS